MSKYQYYEFRALDRRLTAEQQRRLRSLSSRAEISVIAAAAEASGPLVPASDDGIADWVTAFTARVRELRTRYAKRPSLMERFDKAGLPRLG